MKKLLFAPEVGSELLEDDYLQRAKPVITLEALLVECGEDNDLKELLNEMLDYCARYTITVIESKHRLVSGEELSPDDRAEKDNQRKKTHDATMVSINIFSRLLSNKGKNGSWIKEMAGNRAAYGKFAMLLTFSRLLEEKEQQ